MKKNSLIIPFFALIFLFAGCNMSLNNEKREAKEILATCRPISESWLKELDTNGYGYLSTLKISDLLKIEVSDSEINTFGLAIEKEFGKVKERKFMGTFFWLDHKMLIYFPKYDRKLMERFGLSEAKDGFYIIDSKYMGLSKPGDMFKTFPDGNYVIMMYNSVPTNQPTAGEAVIFWQDGKKEWKIVSYKIAVDL